MELDDIFRSHTTDQQLQDEKRRPRKEHLPSMCRYKSKPCFNPRASKRNGAPHNLCEEHRAQANNNQLRFELRRRHGAAHTPIRERHVPVPQRQSRVGRLARVARIASMLSREAAARRSNALDQDRTLRDPVDSSSNEFDICNMRIEDSSSSTNDIDSAAASPFSHARWLGNVLDPRHVASEIVWAEVATAAASSEEEVEREEEVDSWRQLAIQWDESSIDASDLPLATGDSNTEVLDCGYQRDLAPMQVVWI